MDLVSNYFYVIKNPALETEKGARAGGGVTRLEHSSHENEIDEIDEAIGRE